MTTETGATVLTGFEVEKRDTKGQTRSDIVARLEEFGIKNCPEEIIDRLVMIGEHSGFNIDSEMVCEAFGNVLAVFDAKNPEDRHLTPEQKRDGLLGAFLHDIGKSGPPFASLECRLSIIKLYSVKNKSYEQMIPGTQLVSETVKTFFPDDSDEMLKNLSTAGITPDTTMRTFWDKHAWWTRGTLLKYPEVFSERMVLISSSHHMIQGINPCGISEDNVPSESRVIGTLEHYVDLLEGRILMVIDKYQAALTRRGDANHETAMAFLGMVFEKYKEDAEMALIIETIDELGRTDSLFPKTKIKYQKAA